jgi:hypothetical protein
MRSLLALLLLVLTAAPASAQMLLSGAAPAPTCPVGTPSPDGSAIFQVGVGQTSCILTDAAGFRWDFTNLTLNLDTGSGFVAQTQGLNQLQINHSGRAFALPLSCDNGPTNTWLVLDSSGQFVPAISPTVLVTPPIFRDNTLAQNFGNLFEMTNNPPVAGDALEVFPLQGGVPIWRTAGRITVANLTFTLDAGSKTGCTIDEGSAVLTVDPTGGAPVRNITVQAGAGSPMPEIAWGRDPSGGNARGINFGRVPIFTVNGVYFHDNDFGVQAGNVTQFSSTTWAATGGGQVTFTTPSPHSIAVGDSFLVVGSSPAGYNGTYTAITGTTGSTLVAALAVNPGAISVEGWVSSGTLTINNSLFVHNGTSAPGQGSATHNVYIGTFPQTFNLTNSQSYCLGRTNSSTDGFEVKSRPSTGTWTNYIAAGTNPITADTDCMDSAAVDLPCGGVYTLGGTLTGTGGVVELALNAQNTAAFRIADNIADCANGVQWPTTSITIQKHWILLDAPGTPVVGLNTLNLPVTVKNSNIACNTTQTCNSSVLGTNITDGGGNVFNTRAGFGLGACTSVSACPLPAVM